MFCNRFDVVAGFSKGYQGVHISWLLSSKNLPLVWEDIAVALNPGCTSESAGSFKNLHPLGSTPDKLNKNS